MYSEKRLCLILFALQSFPTVPSEHRTLSFWLANTHFALVKNHYSNARQWRIRLKAFLALQQQCDLQQFFLTEQTFWKFRPNAGGIFEMTGASLHDESNQADLRSQTFLLDLSCPNTVLWTKPDSGQLSFPHKYFIQDDKIQFPLLISHVIMKLGREFTDILNSLGGVCGDFPTDDSGKNLCVSRAVHILKEFPQFYKLFCFWRDSTSSSYTMGLQGVFKSQ